CATFPSPWEYWVPGMAAVKIHSAMSNAISPKPAMMNSEPLLSQLACNIFNTLPNFLVTGGGAKLGHDTVPIRDPTFIRQVRHAQIDPHLQALHVRKVDPPTPWSEDAVIEHDVGVHLTRENHASHHQIDAHDANPTIASSQAIRELLREHDQRGALARSRQVQSAADQR